jgi:hypothetical protein
MMMRVIADTLFSLFLLSILVVFSIASPFLPVLLQRKTLCWIFEVLLKAESKEEK